MKFFNAKNTWQVGKMAVGYGCYLNTVYQALKMTDEHLHKKDMQKKEKLEAANPGKIIVSEVVGKSYFRGIYFPRHDWVVKDSIAENSTPKL